MSKAAAIVTVVAIFVSSCQWHVRSDRMIAHQWRVTELSFSAREEYADPFDIDHIRFWAVFRGPDDRELVVPGFWDGGTTWRIRFTPTTPGRWTYDTYFTIEDDDGLHGKHGRIRVAEPTNETALRKHGGFLAVSENQRYLTHTDGTPFFWLGDTWWRVPSSFVPFEHFQTMVDTRVRQGFTVFQALGHVGFGSPPGVTVFDSVRSPSEATIGLWQTTDSYIRYAESKGMVAVIGFGGRNAIDQVELSDLKKLWWYYLARYAAYPITFLITQEYNAAAGAKEARVSKILGLGRFIHETDPYGRAMTVHPWVASRDQGEARGEDWYGFAMMQGGHFARPNCDSYQRAYQRLPWRPILEAELNYEGFRRGGFHVDDAEVRRSAYSAVQCGSFGFSYGAQGLYAGVTDVRLPGPTGNWGPVLTWEEGLALPGGEQMRHLRTFYESVPWWRLEPWRSADVFGGALVKSESYEIVTLYLPADSGMRSAVALRGLPDHVSYDLRWYDPRTGKFQEFPRVVATSDQMLNVPEPPTASDWLAVLRVRR